MKRLMKTHFINQRAAIYCLKIKRGGGVAKFFKDSYCCKKRDDLSINCEAIKSFSIEITDNESKYIIFNVSIRHLMVIQVSVKITLEISSSKTM